MITRLEYKKKKMLIAGEMKIPSVNRLQYGHSSTTTTTDVRNTKMQVIDKRKKLMQPK